MPNLCGDLRSFFEDFGRRLRKPPAGGVNLGLDSKISLGGGCHDPYCERDFSDWVHLMSQSLRAGRTWPNMSDVLFRLFRKEDFETLNTGLAGAQFPGEGAALFLAGLYDRAKGLSISTDTLGYGYRDLFQRHGVNVILSLCQQFKEHGIIGNDARTLDLYIQVARVTERIRQYPQILPNLLVIGDSGTGKEALARVVHKFSDRRGEFRPVNCAGIPEALLESDLFGHEQGSFTGATTDKEGILAICDNGTVQLDEIDKTPLSLQAKLLRVLQDGEIRKVGKRDVFWIDEPRGEIGVLPFPVVSQGHGLDSTQLLGLIHPQPPVFT